MNEGREEFSDKSGGECQSCPSANPFEGVFTCVRFGSINTDPV